MDDQVATAGTITLRRGSRKRHGNQPEYLIERPFVGPDGMPNEEEGTRGLRNRYEQDRDDLAATQRNRRRLPPAAARTEGDPAEDRAAGQHGQSEGGNHHTSRSPVGLS